MARVDLAHAASKNLTEYDVVIIGSMIEREIEAPAERPLAGAVIWNRLHLHMRLQIDATIEYALPAYKPVLTYRDLQIASPYNTYLHAGLPPTPIANPGLASLQAAAHPAGVDYLLLRSSQRRQRPALLLGELRPVSQGQGARPAVGSGVVEPGALRAEQDVARRCASLRAMAGARSAGSTPALGARDVTTIAGSTVLTGIIGWPVTHSLSPAMHNAAFAALGLDMAYVPLPVAPQDVEAAVKGLRALGFRGANVTMPHKAAVLPFLDHVADDALRIAAVNTIVVDDDALRGYNTDVDGFVAALRDVVAEPLDGASGLVLGAGGAARAAALGLLRLGVARLGRVNRTAAHGRGARRPAPGARPSRRVSRSWPSTTLAAAQVREADVLVNATPLGMGAPLKVPGVLVDNIRRDHIVYDVVYGQRPTMPLERARAMGARAIDGLSMLAWQAALSFELWTGRAAPLEVMRSAARR